MAVSYAGIPLPTITQESASWAEAALRMGEWDLFHIRQDPSQTLSRVSIANVDDPYLPKLGCLQWPRSAREWAVGLFLATDTQLAAIRSLVYSGGGYAKKTLVLDDESGKSNRSISTDLWMLPNHPICQIPGYKQLYCLVLVDDRYFANQQSVSLTINSGTTDYPTAIHSALSAALLDTGSVVDTPNAAYLKPGAGHNCISEYAPMMVDSLAYNAGQRYCRTLDGKSRVQNLSTAQAAEAANSTLGFSKLCGGTLDLSSDSVSMVPHQLQIGFPNLDSPGTIITKTAATVSGPTATGTKVFRSTGVSISDAVWTPSAALQAYTDKFATDWVAWLKGTTNELLAGICNWTPNAFDDMVEWTFNEDNISTRIVRGAVDDLTEDLIHAIPSLPTVSSIITGKLTADSITVTNINATGVINNSSSSTTFTGTVNNLTTTTPVTYITTATSSPVLNGITNPDITKGQYVTLINSSSNPITINNLSGSSVAHGQILTGTGGAITWPAGSSVELQYIPALDRYVVVGGTSAPVLTTSVATETLNVTSTLFNSSSTASISGTVNSLSVPTPQLTITSATSTPIINGLSNPDFSKSNKVTITNTSGSSIQITNASGSAGAHGKIFTGTGANITLATGKSLELEYIPSLDEYIPMSGTGYPAGGGSAGSSGAVQLSDGAGGFNTTTHFNYDTGSDLLTIGGSSGSTLGTVTGKVQVTITDGFTTISGWIPVYDNIS
jgi:hypothetical protein